MTTRDLSGCGEPMDRRDHVCFPTLNDARQSRCRQFESAIQRREDLGINIDLRTSDQFAHEFQQYLGDFDLMPVRQSAYEEAGFPADRKPEWWFRMRESCVRVSHDALSYQLVTAAHGISRSMYLLGNGAGGRNRTDTGGKAHGILSPARLPVSPLRPGR
jgi:hypothetical protein